MVEGTAPRLSQTLNHALMGGRRIFKKIDSAMRGHVGDEIRTLLGIIGQSKAVVCPAAIEAGRTVRDGQLWIHGLPLHHSDFAHDPRWPATSADMDALVGVSTTHLSLATVRAGVEALAGAIVDAPTSVVTVDACEHSDLALISQTIVLSDSMPCGALGLARAWARCYSGNRHDLPRLPSDQRGGPVLVVAGSRHPRTHTQVQQLLHTSNASVIEVSVPMHPQHQQAVIEEAIASLSAGKTTVIRAAILNLADASAQRILVQILSDLTRRLCEAVPPAMLVLTGGETASAISRQLDATGVRILGEVEVGLPWGRIIGGLAGGSLIVTKAGGFGGDNAFVKTVQLLSAARYTT